jgi:uncharacterized protein YegP (UPF0339 family)
MTSAFEAGAFDSRPTIRSYREMKALLTIEIYKSQSEWRWRITHRNGNIIADSGEGYKRKSDCKRGVIRMTTALAAGEYETKEP